MKILSITIVQSEIIETDDEDWPTKRRNSADNWETLMGESWEPTYFCEELEELYQQFKKG